MSARTRTPMEVAAGGLDRAGSALANIYEATRQSLLLAEVGAGRALLLAERAVAAGERVAGALERIAEASKPTPPEEP